MSTGPRLVYDADAPESRPAPPPESPRARRPWLALLLVAALGLAGFAWWRATALATQVEALTVELASARDEIAARRVHLDAIRGSVEELRERVTGLASLVADEPTAASVPPAEAAPAR